MFCPMLRCAGLLLSSTTMTYHCYENTRYASVELFLHLGTVRGRKLNDVDLSLSLDVCVASRTAW